MKYIQYSLFGKLKNELQKENPKNYEKLEQRLACLDATDILKLKNALTVPHINPAADPYSMPYLKYDLRDAICNYFSEKCGKKFDKDIYNIINKEPLKRVWYGIKSTANMPTKFLNCLTDYEKLYFFAGRWAIRKPDLDKPIEIITIEHIKKGLDLLYEHHYTRKAKGVYRRELKLPEDAEIRRTYRRIMFR